MEAEAVEVVEYESVEPITDEGRALAAQWHTLLAAALALTPVERCQIASIAYRRWVLPPLSCLCNTSTRPVRSLGPVPPSATIMVTPWAGHARLGEQNPTILR